MTMDTPENAIPLFDCPVDYLIGDATGKIMNEYGRFPCKIKCGVFVLMVEGSASATINITKHEIHKNDVAILEPDSFLLIHEFSEDALVYYILFSSSFLEKHPFNDRFLLHSLQLRNHIISVTEEKANVLKELSNVLTKASNTRPSMLNSDNMVHVFHFLQSTYLNFIRQNEQYQDKPVDRKEEIYQEYVKMVMAHYHEWHHVNNYAKAMRVSIPHLSSTVRQVSGKNARDIIDDAILTDAKAQLKMSNAQVKQIALSLGFENVAFFNRFFRSHVKMTPREYRVS